MKPSNAELVGRQLATAGLPEHLSRRHMSTEARQALHALVEAAQKNQSFKIPASVLVADLNIYEFERFCRETNIPAYCQWVVDAMKACRTREAREQFDVRAICAFKPLRDYDLEVIRERGLRRDRDKARLPLPTEPHSANTYRWVTEVFLLGDMTPYDMNVLAELCRDFTREELAPRLEKLLAPEKRVLKFLLDDAKELRAKRDSLRAKQAEVDDTQRQRLFQLVRKMNEARESAISPPLRPTSYFDEWLAEEARRRAEAPAWWAEVGSDPTLHAEQLDADEEKARQELMAWQVLDD